MTSKHIFLLFPLDTHRVRAEDAPKPQRRLKTPGIAENDLQSLKKRMQGR